MKKYWYIFLAFILVITICGCSKDDPVDPDSPIVEPKEYYFKDTRCELVEILQEDQFGPAAIQICIICANENLQRMGNIVTLTTTSAIPLFIYDTRIDPPQPSFESHLSWHGITGITDQNETGAVVAVVPTTGEFDFVLTTVQPFGHIPGIEDMVTIHESTPPLHLKMWQEGDEWKAELTTKKN